MDAWDVLRALQAGEISIEVRCFEIQYVERIEFRFDDAVDGRF